MIVTMEQAAEILVVDDEPYIAEMLSMSLRYAGHRVTAVATGSDALRALRSGTPDLVILDVMLPDISGFDLLSKLRVGGLPPVLFLTARDSVEDKVHGLTLGGDDYVTKPFSLEEVVARVGALLRRRSSTEATVDAESLRYADLVMDEDAHQVWRQEQLVQLSPTEFGLLRFLLRNAGKVLSRAQILDNVWHYDFNGDSSVVDSYIRYLRRKIDVFDPPLIETVRGIGYSLRLPRPQK
ncbi:MAG TPA: response regulator transcription factor [Propionicimonas sp.]|jgi:two-component system, OmpR family, response regulator|nr:response regulator transcription factor [Propionicimonas sp.]